MVVKSESFRGHALMRIVVGNRFSDCELRNFSIGRDQFSPKRQKALHDVTEYCRALREPFVTGRNMLIAGTVGCGKTHLACSVIRVALGYGIDSVFVRGSKLCDEMRERVVSDDVASVVPMRYATVPLLVIDDIEPSAEGASKFEQRALLELIDRRYRDRLRTVVTTNARSNDELAALVGRRAVERLTDGAVTVITKWPTYRQPGV